MSVAKAGCNVGADMPKKFVDWIRWKLGDKISDEYMIPYNRKMFGVSCLTRRAHGKQPGHAEFYYPKKFGYGELWRRMAQNISSRVEYGKTVSALNFDTATVTTTDGDKYTAEKIITTIPWREFGELRGMPTDLAGDIQRLKHTSIQTEYFPENLNSAAHWAYFADAALPYHRILYQHNFNHDWRGYWTETRSERAQKISDGRTTFRNDYAYPLNTLDKPQIMRRLLTWCRARNVYGLGRWGEHNHYNSDVTAELAMSLAEKI